MEDNGHLDDCEGIEAAIAFGRGCDARLVGKPIEACPVLLGHPGRSEWKRGWKDVHNCWGEEVEGRWRFKPLPPLVPVAEWRKKWISLI